ncbi:MAG: response regulator [Devosia nanyangense]|uniref:Response regulator n=1 Tax=Devosia nanyangense TaxID=1228055 RepID=A0A933L6W5_9HYPH|nr:response regulator [Devosia nanyangense]
MMLVEEPRYSILVVDDQPEWAEDLQEQGHELGLPIDFEVERNASSAARRLTSPTRYDLVMVDLFLKRGLGLDVIERAITDGVTAPFAIVSATGRDDLKVSDAPLFERYQNSGAIQYIDKSDIRGARAFSDYITSIIRAFAQVTNLNRLREERRASILRNATGEISVLLDVLRSYREDIDSSATFSRLCGGVSAALDTIRETTEGHGERHRPRRLPYRPLDLVPLKEVGLKERLDQALRRARGLTATDDIRVAMRDLFLPRTSDRAIQTACRVVASRADRLFERGKSEHAVAVLLGFAETLPTRRGGLERALELRLLATEILISDGRKQTAHVIREDVLRSAAKLGIDYSGFLGEPDRSSRKRTPSDDDE